MAEIGFNRYQETCHAVKSRTILASSETSDQKFPLNSVQRLKCLPAILREVNPIKTFLNEHLSLTNIGKTKSDLLTDTASLEIIAKLLTINYIY